ncbi:MAG: tRNA (adenosine(37)-N6)-threonylcarbamoyltransferase complex ATPase subunit type 1 TsaE [Opitutaceae bacterium]
MDLLATLRSGAVTHSAGETRRLAAKLAATLPPEAVLALHGDLGVGKTTFVQGLARGLGIAEPVTSPTFTVFALHRGGSRLLVHIDAYRLGSGAELEALMIDDFLIPPHCAAVEWPEHVTSWLPKNAWHLTLAIGAARSHSVRLTAPA